MTISSRPLAPLCALLLVLGAPAAVRAQVAETPPATTAHDAGQTTEPRSSWLPWTVVGVGALSLVVSAVFLTDLVSLVNPALDDARTYRADPDIACPGSAPSQSCFDERLAVLNQAAGLDLLAAAPLGVGGAIAVASGIAMLLEVEE